MHLSELHVVSDSLVSTPTPITQSREKTCNCLTQSSHAMTVDSKNSVTVLIQGVMAQNRVSITRNEPNLRQFA